MSTPEHVAMIEATVARQRAFFQTGATRPVAVRVAALHKLKREMQARETILLDALYADLPASVLRDRYALQVTDITQLTTTIAEVEQVKGVVKVSAALDVANGFVTVRNVAVGVTVILLSVLLVVSFFIISNAIKMAMARREEEIAIMKMVGATNAFVRWPFVVEGLVLGIASAIVASALQWGIYSLITQAVNHYSHIRLVSILPYQTLALPVSCVYLGIGLLVGVCGSLITIRKFLRV